MASKYSVAALAVLVIMILQALPYTHQLYIALYPRYQEYGDGGGDDDTVVCKNADADADRGYSRDQINRLKQALWDADYKIMSLILEQKLLSTEQLCPSCRGNSETLTIFAPRDGAVRFDWWTSIPYQIVPEDLSGKLGALTGETETLSVKTCASRSPSSASDVTISRSPGTGNVSINHVPLSHWDIYNDGRLIVHGVDDFFRYTDEWVRQRESSRQSMPMVSDQQQPSRDEMEWKGKRASVILF